MNQVYPERRGEKKEGCEPHRCVVTVPFRSLPLEALELMRIKRIFSTSEDILS